MLLCYYFCQSWTAFDASAGRAATLLELKDEGINRQAPQAAGLTYDTPDYNRANAWVEDVSRSPASQGHIFSPGCCEEAKRQPFAVNVARLHSHHLAGSMRICFLPPARSSMNIYTCAWYTVKYQIYQTSQKAVTLAACWCSIRRPQMQL